MAVPIRAASSPRLALALVLVLGPGAACTSSDAECDATGTAEVDVGVLRGEAFVPFADGDAIDVVHGFQGGMWVMPAVKVFDVAAGGNMSGAMTLLDGTLVGDGDHDVQLELASDGSRLLRYIPIPVGA